MRNKLVKTFKMGIIVAGLCGVFGMVGYADTHYTLNATVIEVQDNEITVQDSKNRVWGFYGDGFTIGQDVILRMDTKGTDNIIKDDEIVDVKCVRH